LHWWLDTTVEVSDDFDFDDRMDFYGIGIVGEKDDVWQVVEECPGVGYRHSGSTLTAFYWDGRSLGWSCFAQGCPLHGMSIGQVIAFLNAQKGEPYMGHIDTKSMEPYQHHSLDSLRDAINRRNKGVPNFGRIPGHIPEMDTASVHGGHQVTLNKKELMVGPEGFEPPTKGL